VLKCQELPEKMHFQKNSGQTEQPTTERQTDTLTDNKCHLMLSACEPKKKQKGQNTTERVKNNKKAQLSLTKPRDAV